MKNFKKVVAAAAAVAMTMSIGVSAFAEAAATYADGKVNVSGVTMDDGKQYTVIVIAADKADETLEAADLYYINQGDNGEAFWTNGLGVKEDLAAGDYIARIGGEDLAEVIEIPFTVGSVAPTYMLGDTTGNLVIEADDAAAVLNHVVGLETLTGDSLLAADTTQNGIVEADDAAEILNKVVGLPSALD